MYLFSPHALRLVVSWEVATVDLGKLRALLMSLTLRPTVPSLPLDKMMLYIVTNEKLRCILVEIELLVGFQLPVQK